MATRSTCRLKISKRRFRSYFRFPDIAKCHRDNDCLFAVSFHVDLPIWSLGEECSKCECVKRHFNKLSHLSFWHTKDLSLSLFLSSFILKRHCRDNTCSSKKRKACLLYVLIFFFFSFVPIEVEDHLSTSHEDKSGEDTFDWLRKVIRLCRGYLRNEILKWCSQMIYWIRKSEGLNLSIPMTVGRY